MTQDCLGFLPARRNVVLALDLREQKTRNKTPILKGIFWMLKTGRLIGGAGTGKTTELLKIMTDAKDRLGGDFLALGFASFAPAAG